jgi:hypothetical protein
VGGKMDGESERAQVKVTSTEREQNALSARKALGQDGKGCWGGWGVGMSCWGGGAVASFSLWHPNGTVGLATCLHLCIPQQQNYDASRPFLKWGETRRLLQESYSRRNFPPSINLCRLPSSLSFVKIQDDSVKIISLSLSSKSLLSRFNYLIHTKTTGDIRASRIADKTV